MEVKDIEDIVNNKTQLSKRFRNYLFSGENTFTLKNDILFKEAFSSIDSEKYLLDFAEAIMGRKISKVKVKKDFSLSRTSKKEKYGVLDLHVTVDNKEILDIEMQVLDPRKFWKKTKLLC